MKNVASRSHLPRVALVLAVSLGGAACKKDPPPPPAEPPALEAGAGTGKPGVVASCDMTTEVGSCTEYAKLSAGLEKSLCTGLKGKFAEGKAAGCAPTNEVGLCTMADNEVKHYYGVAIGPQGFAPANAQKDCTSPDIAGKFSATGP